MTTGTDDLWPDDFGSIEIDTPLLIIRKQASFLGNKTSNLVEGFVSNEVDTEGDNIIDFYLYAPALGGYRYKLFTVYHPITDMYPVSLDVRDAKGLRKKVNNEEELKEYLETQFSSERTKKIIRSLIAQSRSA